MRLPTIPATMERVERHTPPAVQRRIHARAQQRVHSLAGAPPHELTRRIEQLEREWDIERWLETNAATVSLIGIGLGSFVDKRWFALPAVVAGFLLQHAIQGWCPPLPVLRRLGVRTAAEINAEIVELRRLRGDFIEGAPDTSAP
ncbi:MAG: hypothetical protein AB7I32_03860 [Gammaproteobacteria bacterium]